MIWEIVINERTKNEAKRALLSKLGSNNQPRVEYGCISKEADKTSKKWRKFGKELRAGGLRKSSIYFHVETKKERKVE